MCTKIIACFVLLGLVQINSAPADIIASYRPQIQNLQIRIGLAIANGGQAIHLARATIGVSVGQAQKTVAGKIAEVNAAIDAVSGNEACKNAAQNALNAINANELAQCKVNRDLDLLGLKLADLGSVKNTLGNLIGVCQQSSATDAALANCLDSGLQAASKEIEQTESEISATCNQAVEKANACNDTVSKKLIAAADKVSSDLKKCIA